MEITVFTDELRLDVVESALKIKEWGGRLVDLRKRINGKAIHEQTDEELKQLKEFLDANDLSVACLESSLGKTHLPDAETHEGEMAKLECLIRAAEILDCTLVRAFFYWQPPFEQRGALATDIALRNEVIEKFLPVARRAHEAGLSLAFENCGCHTYEIHRVIDELHKLGVTSCGLAWDMFHSFEEKPLDLHAFVMNNTAYAKIIHVKAKRCIYLGDETGLPYTDIFRIAHASGYRGAVSVETHNPDKALDALEASNRLFRAVKAAMIEAGV